MSTEERAARFFDRYAYPDWLRRHSVAVGRIAHALAEAHRAVGAEIDVEGTALAGYLHDIGKTPLLAEDPRDHNDLSALVLYAEGLRDLAEAARRHPVHAVLEPALRPRTLEERIVYVADRRGDQSVVDLVTRLEGQVRRHGEYAEQLRRCVPLAQELERDVFAPLPFAIGDLARVVA